MFRSWLYGLALEASVREFESLHLDLILLFNVMVSITGFEPVRRGSSPLTATVLFPYVVRGMTVNHV